ncbi:MAG: hypothetical protein L0221_15815 [Chloroflexi bacterium]|nr:hypothetical protein [Chloroflexota bacterium]
MNLRLIDPPRFDPAAVDPDPRADFWHGNGRRFEVGDCWYATPDGEAWCVFPDGPTGTPAAARASARCWSRSPAARASSACTRRRARTRATGGPSAAICRT